MRKNLIARITNLFKWILLVLSGKDTGLIPVEAEIDIYHNDGIKYLWKKKYKKAIEMFKKMIEYDAGDHLGYQRLGEVYEEIGDVLEARKNYEIALSNAEKRYKRAPYMSEYKSIINEIKEELNNLRSKSNSNSIQN